MQIRNPIRIRREETEQKKREGEEKRRRAEEERKRRGQEAKQLKRKKIQRNILIACGVVLALSLIGLGTGSDSKGSETIPTYTALTSFSMTSATAQPTPTGTILPTETPSPEPSEQLEQSAEPTPLHEQETQEQATSPEQSDAPAQTEAPTETETPEPQTSIPAFSLADVPSYSGSPYTSINGNVPAFTDADFTTTSFESYSQLDSMGRCGPAYACVGLETMPTGERGSIGQVKPSGWHTVKYDIVDGKYLYNRCHLIGYQLTAENANTLNLITGTRYMNVEGMLPFENMVADYIKETGNHVLYRVTPIFEGSNLLASGVHMEAESVEDSGDGILFNVYCYNVQPGVAIDYATGDSYLDGSYVAPVELASPQQQQPESEPEPTQQPTEPEPPAQNVSTYYVVNKNTHKFHLPSCSHVNQVSEKNKMIFDGSRDELIANGYEPCKDCNP